MNEDYVLGRDVTEIVKGKKHLKTVVYSLRLTAAELTELHQEAQFLGCQISDVIRRKLFPLNTTTNPAVYTVTWQR